MKTLNSQTLKKIFISASNNLYNHYEEINALNVFPVPDGDTGINMSLTMTSGANEIENLNSSSCYEIAKAFSRGLLMGARGNSGVITSQIFRGFSQYLADVKDKITPIDLANALKNGSEVAYKAVMRPVEGTILTVIRESSERLNLRIEEAVSIEKTLEILFEEAKNSLKRTPELLPILKEVGVVDSGGAGLVAIMEGMLLAVKGKFVAKKGEKESKNVKQAAARQMENEEFGYCTEFIMSLGPDSVKKPFKQDEVSSWLGNHGTSLVVVVDEDIVKVHVHTMTPGEILNYAQQYGEFLKLKIENMTEQHHALESGAQVQEHKDLVEAVPDKEYAIISVCNGEGIEEYFRELGVTYIVSGGQTMNPSSEDFVSAIKSVKAKNVFILPNNSNIFMAASQACDMFEEDDNISAFVIPSKTIPQGIVACMSFLEDETPANNFKAMKAALSNVKSGEVTFSIRDCEIKGVKIKKDDFIGIYEKDIVCGVEDKFEALKSLLSQMIDDESFQLTLILGEDVTRDEFFAVKKEIQNLYPDINIEIKEGKQPVYSFLVSVE